VLDSSNRPLPKNFKMVQISFRGDTRFTQRSAQSFSKEFYELLSRLDAGWESEMAGQQKIWRDLTEYPTLQKNIRLLIFHQHTPYPLSNGDRWILGQSQRGAYDPQWAWTALVETIRRKTGKSNYGTLKMDQKLDEFILTTP
jgi:hypothetical protein